MPKCKVCGEQIAKKEMKKNKEREHGVAPEKTTEIEPETPKAEEPTVPTKINWNKPQPQPQTFIPDVGMKVWNRRIDLQRAFPRPQDETCAYKLLPNFLAWMKQYGVLEEPEIAAYFKNQTGGI